jgi:hypothetical protein
MLDFWIRFMSISPDEQGDLIAIINEEHLDGENYPRHFY